MMPEVPGVLSRDECHATGQAIARMQEACGSIPWFPGGHTDPWDHIESSMALTVTGLLDEASAPSASCAGHNVPMGRGR